MESYRIQLKENGGSWTLAVLDKEETLVIVEEQTKRLIIGQQLVITRER